MINRVSRKFTDLVEAANLFSFVLLDSKIEKTLG